MKNIKIYNMLMYCLWLALFKIYVIPNSVRQFIKLACILLIFFFIIKNMRSKKYWINPVTFFSIVVIISSFAGYNNNYINIDSFIDAIMYGLCLFCANAMIKYGVDNNKKEVIFNSLFNTMFVYVLFSIVSIAKLGGSDSTQLLMYFGGSKFSTSYYILLFDIMFAIKYKVPHKNRIKFLILTILTILVCSYIKCSTTVVASALLFIFVFNIKSIKRIMINKKTLLISLLISAIAMLLIEKILQNEYVSYFIMNVLNENVTLTGRLKIYSYLLEIASNSPFLGYGYGNQVISSIVGYGNAQNAIFQLIIQHGYIGLTAFIIIFYNAIKNHTEDTLDIFPLYVFIYMMIICSIVEISFNFMFYTVLLIIYAYNQHMMENRKLNKKEK